MSSGILHRLISGTRETLYTLYKNAELCWIIQTHAAGDRVQNTSKSARTLHSRHFARLAVHFNGSPDS